VRICERVVLNDGSEVGVLPNLLGQLAVYRVERLAA
jgi:hypothetical protein